MVLELEKNSDNRIKFVKPNGGYFLWVELENIKDMSDFNVFCQNLSIDFFPGYKLYYQEQ